MRLLVLDSANDYLTVGMVELSSPDNIQESHAEYSFSPNQHSEKILGVIEACLTATNTSLTDLTGIVVGLGPGAFTGLRVGITTAIAFSSSLQIPAWGVNTLTALAEQTPSKSTPTLVITNAKRQEVYVGEYLAGELLSPPRVTKLADLSLPEQANILADPSLLTELPRHTIVVAYPRVTDLVRVALPQIKTRVRKPLTPLYIREPDAKLPKPNPLTTYLQQQND